MAPRLSNMDSLEASTVLQRLQLLTILKSFQRAVGSLESGQQVTTWDANPPVVVGCGDVDYCRLSSDPAANDVDFRDLLNRHSSQERTQWEEHHQPIDMDIESDGSEDGEQRQSKGTGNKR